MVPDGYAFEEEDELDEDTLLPSLTYKVDWENNRMVGRVDGVDAVLQFIQKTLNTDKYAWEIYNWYFGNEIQSLIGKPHGYAKVELLRIIEESLLVDARILSIGEIVFEQMTSDSLAATFDVVTIFGNLTYNGLEVSL